MKVKDNDIIIRGVLNLDNGKRIIQVIEPESLAQIKEIPNIFKESNDLKTSQQEVIDNIENARTQNVTFFIEKQEFGLDVKSVQEIIKAPEIQKGILTADYIEGITILRGKPITVINLRKFIGAKHIPIGIETRLVILKNEKFNCGILVDSIKEVINFYKKDILPVPSMSCAKIKDGIRGVLEFLSGRNILLLNIEKLFKEETVKNISNNTKINAKEEISKVKNEKTIDKEIIDNDNSLLNKVFISYRLEEILAVEIQYVQEIIKYPKDIISVPGEIDYFAGILNLYYGISFAGLRFNIKFVS